MATVIQSNKAYTGSKVLPNIIDFITTTSDKTVYLKKLYGSVQGDTTYITSANADSLFSTLKAHRDRVIADGGVVLSLAMTLRAIIFADKNTLTSANYSAYSAGFGVKLSGSTVVKVYDLSGRDQTAVIGSFTRTVDANLNVISASVASSLIATTQFTGGAGTIIGSSSNDVNSDTTSLVRAPALFQNAQGTGSRYMDVENNNGNVARLSYTLNSGTATSINYSQAGANYLKYAGIVGISIGGGASTLYENGIQKSTSATASKDLTGLSVYLGATISSANSFLNESWIINSTSTSLAQALSVHLNKSIFN